MSTQPNLIISYSPDFSLEIQFSSVQRYAVVCSEYRFDFTCRVLHSKGEFTYAARDICFDPQSFKDFAGQLDAIRNGKAKGAEFHEVGHMIEFSINIRDRKPQASVRIREYQPNGEQTVLSAGFGVDYDLFVNALYSKTTEFLKELADIG